MKSKNKKTNISNFNKFLNITSIIQIVLFFISIIQQISTIHSNSLDELGPQVIIFALLCLFIVINLVLFVIYDVKVLLRNTTFNLKTFLLEIFCIISIPTYIFVQQYLAVYSINHLY